MKNRVQLIGHVGQDPEIKQLENGRVANFTIATNDSYTNTKGEKVEQTEWHRISAWGKTVDIIEQLLKKGSHVAIEGKLTHRSYDDKDGNKRYITEVVANELVMLN